MFEELTSSLCLLKLHVIDFVLAFSANSSDKSLWIVQTNVEFLRQMVFQGKINNKFTKSALDFLLVIHYNYWCVLPNYKVIQHFRTLWLGFPYGRSFGDFRPLKVNFNSSDTQKAHPYTKPRLLSHHTSTSVANNCGP